MVIIIPRKFSSRSPSTLKNMAYHFYLLIVLIASCYAGEKFGTGMSDIKNFIAYFRDNLNTQLTPLENPIWERRIFHYMYGKRVKGDKQIAQKNEYFVFPESQDYQYTIRHPTSGEGALVTMMDIFVDQTSNVGEVHIISGGIGQRHIDIGIDAKNTTLLSYRLRIYGQEE